MHDITFQFLERMRELGVNSYHIKEHKTQMANGYVVISVDIPGCCPLVELFPRESAAKESIRRMIITSQAIKGH